MSPESGGTSQGVRNTNNELIKLGVYIEVACMDDPAASFLNSDSFTIYALGPCKTPWQYAKNLLPWLIKNIPRFDVVIVNGLWLYHGYAVRKAMVHLKKAESIPGRKIFNQKYFVMPHGMLDPYFQHAKGRVLKAIRNFFYWSIIESKLVNNCDGLLFTSETELNLARRAFNPYRPKKEINVGYGTFTPPLYNIDMRDAFLKKCNHLSSTPYILFIGRIDEKKGVASLIKAYINILKTSIDVDIPKLVIAGPGLNTQYGREMLKLAAPAAGAIVFTGMLTGDAKWGAFYGCQAFILPSHQENFGIAVVEALACSKPVLISNQVNIWREVKLEGCGIVAADTLEGTAELLSVWNNVPYEEKVDMGMYARFCFEKFYDITNVSIKFLEAIKS